MADGAGLMGLVLRCNPRLQHAGDRDALAGFGIDADVAGESSAGGSIAGLGWAAGAIVLGQSHFIAHFKFTGGGSNR
jgi:hypothetical protein